MNPNFLCKIRELAYIKNQMEQIKGTVNYEREQLDLLLKDSLILTSDYTAERALNCLKSIGINEEKECTLSDRYQELYDDLLFMLTP